MKKITLTLLVVSMVFFSACNEFETNLELQNTILSNTKNIEHIHQSKAFQNFIERLNEEIETQESYHYINYPHDHSELDATFFHTGKNITKIIGQHFGRFGKSEYEIFFIHENISYINVKKYDYNVPIFFTESYAQQEGYTNTEFFDLNKSQITKNQYLVQDNTLIMWLKEDNYIHEDENIEQYANEEKIIVTLQKEIIDIFANKDSIENFADYRE